MDPLDVEAGPGAVLGLALPLRDVEVAVVLRRDFFAGGKRFCDFCVVFYNDMFRYMFKVKYPIGICKYVCMYVPMYGMYVPMYICTYVPMYVCTYLCMIGTWNEKTNPMLSLSLPGSST